MDAITYNYRGDVQMIDGTSVRFHQSAATFKKLSETSRIWE